MSIYNNNKKKIQENARRTCVHPSLRPIHYNHVHIYSLTSKLWNYIADFEDNDRTQFLLVLQLKLVDKAAEAVQSNRFENWDAVKADLMEHITPHRKNRVFYVVFIHRCSFQA